MDAVRLVDCTRQVCTYVRAQQVVGVDDRHDSAAVGTFAVVPYNLPALHVWQLLHPPQIEPLLDVHALERVGRTVAVAALFGLVHHRPGLLVRRQVRCPDRLGRHGGRKLTGACGMGSVSHNLCIRAQ